MSEKHDKQLANRALRRGVEKISTSTILDDVEANHRLKNGSWLFSKDGKQYIHKVDFESDVFRKLTTK
jgi:hypothetical protein